MNKIKYKRPDLIENYSKSLIAEVRHEAFLNISRRNLGTMARISWHQRPTIILFDETNKNPVEFIEMASWRNKSAILKISLSDSTENEVLEKISLASATGSWIILENLHLMKKNVIILIKKVF